MVDTRGKRERIRKRKGKGKGKEKNNYTQELDKSPETTKKITVIPVHRLHTLSHPSYCAKKREQAINQTNGTRKLLGQALVLTLVSDPNRRAGNSESGF